MVTMTASDAIIRTYLLDDSKFRFWKVPIKVKRTNSIYSGYMISLREGVFCTYYFSSSFYFLHGDLAQTVGLPDSQS